MANRKNYTDEDIIRYTSEVKSMAQLLRKLGLKEAGGNYAHMNRKLKTLKIDCSHWTRQLWNKGERLKDWPKYIKNSSIKRHLLEERGHKCENCSLETWLGKHIPIELHHVDGDRTNNHKGNLQLLCPNCHFLTPNYRGRNRNKKKSK